MSTTIGLVRVFGIEGAQDCHREDRNDKDERHERSSGHRHGDEEPRGDQHLRERDRPHRPGEQTGHPAEGQRGENILLFQAFSLLCLHSEGKLILRFASVFVKILQEFAKIQSNSTYRQNEMWKNVEGTF